MPSHNRQGQRSKPISRMILQNKDTNASAVTAPSSKKSIRSLIQGNSLKRQKQTPAVTRSEPPATPTELRKISQLVTPSQKFQIYRDVNITTNKSSTQPTALKTPVSELKHTQSWKQEASLPDHAQTPTKNEKKKITRDAFQQQEFKIRGIAQTSPFPFHLVSQDSDSSSELMNNVLQPIVKLDQWYKIHQVEILTKDPIEETHTVLESSPFNEMLTFVKVQATDGTLDEVLLLNYRQSVATMNKFQNVKKGDRVLLIEGFDILGEKKMYHNWKLKI